MYSSSNNINDIGLIETTTQILYSRGVGPACLPFVYLANTFVNSSVDVAGWGSVSGREPYSNTLKKATVKVISNSVCKSTAPNITSSQMCILSPLVLVLVE